MSHLNELYAKRQKLAEKLEQLDSDIKIEQANLRQMVTVKEYKTFIEFQYNDRKIRAKWNSYGDVTLTENGKKLPIKSMIRPSVRDIRLLVATGRI